MKKLLISVLKLYPISIVVVVLLNSIKRFSVEYFKSLDKSYIRPRNWSNQELKNFSDILEGSVINVSGWKDEDKVGGYIKTTFQNRLLMIYQIFTEKRGFRTIQMKFC